MNENNESPTNSPYDTPWDVYLENEHDPRDGLWTTIYAPDADTARLEANAHYGEPYVALDMRQRTGQRHERDGSERRSRRVRTAGTPTPLDGRRRERC